MRVLYLSYDGALDPLGRSQVVPYVEGLTGRGHHFDLLTFEKPDRLADAEAVETLRGRLDAHSVRWHPHRYHKRPPVLATALDIAVAVRASRRIVREGGIDLLHARSYPAALAARLVGLSEGIPYLFDMRGLWADERVDGGLWRAGGILYRTTRRVERDLLRDAAAVVTLTEASRPVVRHLLEEAGAASTPLRVVPTCVDAERFRPGGADDGGGPVLAYFGSIGTWYMLPEMTALGAEWVRRVPGGRLLFLVNQATERVRGIAREAGIPDDRIEVRSVPHERVPAALDGAEATFFLIRPAPSKIASAPTKFGESLALGLPVLLNRGVGDAAEVAEEEGVGVVVEAFDAAAYRAAVEGMRALLEEEGISERCRRVARELYALDRCVEAYDALYREIVP